MTFDEMEDLEFTERLLEIQNTTDTDLSTLNDGEVLRWTFKIYGTTFAVLFLTYCFLRSRYPSIYNTRSWAPNLKCDLATKEYGFISWFWWQKMISDDEILENCGMDALCVLRILDFGLRVSMVGIFNSIWLMPIYAVESDATADITDKIVRVSVTHVPSMDPRLISTAVAAWIVFGYAMWQILRDFRWFSAKRDHYLGAIKEKNYSIYVRGIPTELRENDSLKEYFCEIFNDHDVLEANVTLTIPMLEKKVATRDKVIANLEHAMNIYQIKGESPKHLDILQGKKVDSIEAYTKELNELNKDITKIIDDIECLHTKRETIHNIEMALQEYHPKTKEAIPETKEAIPETKEALTQIASGDSSSDTDDDGDSPSPSPSPSPSSWSLMKYIKATSDLTTNISATTTNFLVGDEIDPYTTLNPLQVAQDLTTTSKKLLLGDEDGTPRESGFVTFTNLHARYAALQMVHHESPFVLKCEEAPVPDDIYWQNVGKTNRDLQVGRLLGNAWTVLLCFFWTIPVAFIVSLGNVDKLKEQLPFLNDWIEAVPLIEPALRQLSPLLLLVLNAALPTILTVFAKLEGPISTSVLEATLFVKLSIFTLVQTFFVASISGSLTSAINEMIQDPTKIVEFLAQTLPLQATFFTQLLMISTFIGLGLELLRVKDVALAFIRRLVGPNLSEKERNTTWMGLHPLSDPKEFQFADTIANATLYFMVSFVYSTLSPITSYVMAFCYVLLGAGYRNQFIHIYPTTPDSGGKMWTGFINIVQSMMLIAEVTLVGYFLLKKAVVSVGLMVPLIVITVLFNLYVRQEHFRVATFMPSNKAHRIDRVRSKEGVVDLELFRGAYVQPALKDRELFPESMEMSDFVHHARDCAVGLATSNGGLRCESLGTPSLGYLTPPQSQNDLESVHIDTDHDDDDASTSSNESFASSFAV